MEQDKKELLLNVQNLSKTFVSRFGLQRAVNNVSFRLKKGEVMGLIGQSGSGKSTVANALMKLLTEVNGVATLDGDVVSGKLSKKNTKNFYRKVQMIFQDPHTSLNEKRNVFSTIAEPLLVSGILGEQATEFLSFDSEVMETYEFTLAEKFAEFKRDFAKFRIEHREEAIKEAQANFEAFEIPSPLTPEESQTKFSELVADIYDVLIEAENTIITYLIEQINVLLDFYLDAKSKVEAADIPQDEKDLIIAKRELRQYLVKTNAAEVDKAKKKAIETLTSSDKDYEDQNKRLLEAFIHDRNVKAKINKEFGLLSDTNEGYDMFMSIRERRKLEVELLNKHITPLKLFASRELLYEANKRLFRAPEDEIESILIDIASRIKTQQEEWDAELLAKITAKKAEFVAEELNPAHQAQLEESVRGAQETFDIAKEEARTEHEERLASIAREVEEFGGKDRMLANKVARKEIQAKFSDIVKKLLVPLKTIPSTKDGKDVDKLSRFMLRYEKIVFGIKRRSKKLSDENRFEIRRRLELKQSLLRRADDMKRVVRNKTERFDAHLVELRVMGRTTSRIKTIYGLTPYSYSIVKKLMVRRLILQREVMKSLTDVGMKPEHAYRYPHEFSGGQKQRINIARALITKPKLIVADEPVASLDVSIQAQVINILVDLVRKQGISMIFIGHDLSVIEYLADSINVMHLGRVVERGSVESVFKTPLHPYTQTLFEAIPKISNANIPFESKDVDPTYLREYAEKRPLMRQVGDEHFIFANEDQLTKWGANEITPASDDEDDEATIITKVKKPRKRLVAKVKLGASTKGPKQPKVKKPTTPKAPKPPKAKKGKEE